MSSLLAECDATVIGGGAAGLICAASLASSGLSTILIEPRGSLWWEVSWARQRVALEPSPDETLLAFHQEISAAQGVRGGFVEPVIAQLAADRFCLQRQVRLLFHARPIQLECQESGDLRLKLALKGKTGEIATHWCLDCSDNGLLTRLNGVPAREQTEKFTFWCLTFSHCETGMIQEKTFFLGGNEVRVRLRPGFWTGEAIVDIAYPASSHGSYPVELTFTSDLEPLVLELRRLVPELKDAVLAHIADAPWSLPEVCIKPDESGLIASGPEGRVLGAGCWLETALNDILAAPFWEQSSKAINLAMRLGAAAARKVKQGEGAAL